MFSILKKVGEFVARVGEKIQDAADGVIELKHEVPQMVVIQRAKWGLNKKGNIALLGYYCSKAGKDCNWYGVRCGKCANH